MCTVAENVSNHVKTWAVQSCVVYVLGDHEARFEMKSLLVMDTLNTC
jgi:hypothetical protein